MIDYIKRYIKTIRLNSFHPLCETKIGLNAIKEFGFPPFIDASCRREPDFENQYPSISALCRQGSFAPNLFPNDIIIYVSVKGKWFQDFRHYRLIAILEVIERKETHTEAKLWYLSKGLTIPSNCMVDDNPPHSFHETAGNYENQEKLKKFLNYPIEIQKKIGKNRIEQWNNEYLKKTKKWGCFIITNPIYLNLTDPPILKDKTIFNIFKKKINTRNPNIINPEAFKEIAKFANINFMQLD